MALIAGCVLAQDIDRPARPEEWGYRPENGAAVQANPPSFSWVPFKGATSYEVEWSSFRDLSRSTPVKDVKWTVYTHNAPLKPGSWYWRYRAVVAGTPTEWSRIRQFDVSSKALLFPQPTLAEVKSRIVATHPRVFLKADDLPRLRAFAAGPGKAAWAKLLEKAEELAARAPTPEPPVMANSKDPATNQFWWSNRAADAESRQ